MRPRNLVARRATAWTLGALAGCATAPTAPALQMADQKRQLAPLVPVRRFVANIDFAGGYQLSPDGAWLLDALTAAQEGYPDL